MSVESIFVVADDEEEKSASDASGGPAKRKLERTDEDEQQELEEKQAELEEKKRQFQKERKAKLDQWERERNAERRSAVAHLSKPLHPEVLKVIQDKAKIMIGNYKRMKAVKATDRTTKLPDAEKEKMRQLAFQLHTGLTGARELREKVDDMRGPLLDGESALTIDGKQESVTVGFKQHTTVNNTRNQVGDNNYTGTASDRLGDVQALNPGYKIGEQTLQILGHLSQLFMNRVTDLEYQSMLVNGRIFIAANAQAKIEKFRDVILQDFLTEAAKTIVADGAPSKDVRPYKIGSVSAALKLDPTSKVPLTQQEIDGAATLAEYEFGHHVDPGARPGLQSVLNVLQHQARTKLKVIGPFPPAEAAGYIDQDGYENTVILVHSLNSTGWHAEQSLSLMLTEVGWTDRAIVGGTKLPCFTCWLTLNLMNQRGYTVECVQTPGFIWETNTLPGLTRVAKELGVETLEDLLDYFDLTKTLTGNQFQQFMTALKEQRNLSIDWANETLGTLKKKGMTQAQSKKSGYFGKAKQVPLDQAPFPAKEPFSPPQYYKSDDDEVEEQNEEKKKYAQKLDEDFAMKNADDDEDEDE
ncbi:MAG TPA: hypothetical protein VGM10_14725 [Actinocrinis sp.]